jgi:hypothetical protein
MRKLFFAVMAAGLLTFAAKPSSAAVSLKQNWQAGQQLVYDTHIDGTLNLQVPADAPTIIAGMPLEIDVRGVGKTTLNTLKVNDFGDGTVQVKVNPLSVEGETYGQKALIKVNDGNAVMTLNGEQQKNNFLDWNLLTNPPATLTFSPLMKVTEVSSINAAPAAATSGAAPMNATMSMVQNLILQSLPALLPAKSVNVGDQWTADVQLKTSPAPNAAVIKLGSFQFQLKDPETMEGHSLQHITVNGAIDMSSEQSKTLTAGFGASAGNSDNSGELGGMLSKHLLSLSQTVDGDLYFDAGAGQLIQADLNLNTDAQTLPNTGQPSEPDGSFGFNGTLRLKLSQVINAKP